jgi:NAD-dependent deacetylase
LREVTCIQCYETQNSTEVFEKFVRDGQTPRCSCGGVLKPNVILFGEQLPVREFVAAQLAVKGADLMLIVGSSLETAPASDLPELALQHGARLIIVNYQPTFVDHRADVVIRADVAEVLPRIMARVVA